MSKHNFLYYGDNLDVLRRHVADESIDLVYLDPPFKSDRNYNVLFAEQDGTRAAAQIKAFEDTWQWDRGAAAEYEAVVEAGGKVSEVLQGFRLSLGETDLLAYLAMMASRLVQLYRVLKSTGSLYLHCDPTASHYLKMLLDAVFGPKRFLNEITWKRSSAHSDSKQGMRRCGKIHDVILLYSKTKEYTWNTLYTPYTPEYLESEYRHVDERGRRYKETDLTAAKPGGETDYEWRVRRPVSQGKKKHRWQADLADEWHVPNASWEYRGVKPYNGRYWAYSKANLIQFAREGNLIHRETGMPRLVQYADQMPGISLQDVWDDIPPASGDEDLGYPTQKPAELLERIVLSSSEPGDRVLDPFCGCGTTIAAAQKLGREWTGIDITHLAIGLIKSRLHDTYGDDVKYDVIGEPTTVEGAEELARSDPYQFQWWALGLVGARRAEEKKGADRGIDGKLYFHDGSAKTKQIVLSVKAGRLHANYLRDLEGVRNREKAEIGALISFDEPTKPMRKEAASAGFYTSPWGKHPRLQLLTVADLLGGKGIDYPRTAGVNQTFKRASRVKKAAAQYLELFDSSNDEE